MTSGEIRQKFVDYFKARGHAHIPSASLVPQNDPSTLFVSSGMQPLVPYLLGQAHPSGTRLVNSQICVRAHGFLDDIMEVGDNRHTTFFEMLGNWSLGDYFKKEQLEWFFDFLVNELKLDPKKLYVSVLAKEDAFGIASDSESIDVWKGLFEREGIDAGVLDLSGGRAGNVDTGGARIFYYGIEKNWWSRSGPPAKMPAGEPGGPCSEVFYDFGTPHDQRYGKHCHPNCDCGRFLEIGNSVFMQFQKQVDGTFKELPKRNVDFGAGLERLAAVTNRNPDIFETDLYQPIIKEIEALGIAYEGTAKPHMRVIADHLKAATFLIVQGVLPSNKMQGYVLRKFLRRAFVKMYFLTSGGSLLTWKEKYLSVCKKVVEIYSRVPDSFGFALTESDIYPNLQNVVEAELDKFKIAFDLGLRLLSKIESQDVTGKFAFDLFQNYGFPFEITSDLLAQKGYKLNKEAFTKEFEKHQQLSREGTSGTFRLKP